MEKQKEPEEHKYKVVSREGDKIVYLCPNGNRVAVSKSFGDFVRCFCVKDAKAVQN